MILHEFCPDPKLGRGDLQPKKNGIKLTLSIHRIDNKIIMVDCNQILVGDLFNKTTQKASQEEIYVATLDFFKLNEDEALKRVEKITQRKSGEKLKIKAGFIVEGFPVDLGTSGSGEREYTDQEFKEEFLKWKELISKKIRNEQEFSLDSFYNSVVRDPETIKAWRTCVVTKINKKEGGVVAFVSRDNFDNAVLNIEWKNSDSLAKDNAFLEIDVPDDKVSVKGFTKDEDFPIPFSAEISFLLEIKKDTSNQSIPFVIRIVVKDSDSGNLKNIFAENAVIPPAEVPSDFTTKFPGGFPGTPLESWYAESPYFDAEWYLKNNEDVNKACKGNLACAREHWLKQGLKVECRRGSAEFDAKWYLKENGDLKGSGYDYCIGAFIHWKDHGRKERRKGAP